MREPWRISAEILFCTVIVGRDRIFSKPRLSAAVRMKSRRKPAVVLLNSMPLVGPVAARFENSGIEVGSPGEVMNRGTCPVGKVTLIGLVVVAPPTALLPLPKPTPN